LLPRRRRRAAALPNGEKKTGGALCGAPPEIFQSKWLQRLDVRRLQALGAADDFEFNRLAIVQRLIAISHNRGEMDEYVLTALALDESKALAGVKPLHCSLFFAHFCVSFQDLSYLVLRYVLAAFRAVQNKKAARVTLRTFTNSKGDTRATNATEKYHGWRYIASEIVFHW
jgi:hypothetical protein